MMNPTALIAMLAAVNNGEIHLRRVLSERIDP